MRLVCKCPLGVMMSCPMLASPVPVEASRTFSPASLRTTSQGITLCEYPSNTASMPLVAAMRSVEQKGAEASSTPKCASTIT